MSDVSAIRCLHMGDRELRRAWGRAADRGYRVGWAFVGRNFEATPRFELGNRAFAELRLTTWLRRLERGHQLLPRGCVAGGVLCALARCAPPAPCPAKKSGFLMLGGLFFKRPL